LPCLKEQLKTIELNSSE